MSKPESREKERACICDAAGWRHCPIHQEVNRSTPDDSLGSGPNLNDPAAASVPIRYRVAPPIAKAEEPESVTARTIRLIREDERERCCEAIKNACSMCDGKGYTETSHAAHGCGGDEAMCASGCPVEQIEQEGCEYCGRPIAAIRAALAESADRGEEKA